MDIYGDVTKQRWVKPYILLTHTYLNSKNTDSLTTHYPMAPQQPAAAPS